MHSPVSAPSHHVTAVISHRVRPGREQGYEEWVKGIAAAARDFEGHLGVSILRPRAGKNPNYISVLKFDQVEHLQGWLRSDIRREWMERAQPLILDAEDVQVLTGLEAWFYLPNLDMAAPPPRYKMAAITWIGVQLVTFAVALFLAPLLVSLPFILNLVISNVIVVLALTYLVMPQLTNLFSPWLYPKAK